MNYAFITMQGLIDFHHKVIQRYRDVEAMLDTELEIKFACTQTLRDMLINQCHLLHGPLNRRSPQYGMETNNKRNDFVMKKLQKMYVPDPVVSKFKRKGEDGHDEDNGTDHVPHFEQEANPDRDSDQEKDGVANVDVPWPSSPQRTFPDVADLTDPATMTKSIGQIKCKHGAKSSSKTMYWYHPAYSRTKARIEEG